jgi:hypothetical protein
MSKCLRSDNNARKSLPVSPLSPLGNVCAGQHRLCHFGATLVLWSYLGGDCFHSCRPLWCATRVVSTAMLIYEFY